MDPGYMSGFAALAGSALGATSSLFTTWLTQTRTSNAMRIEREQARQETLYADFIDEASRLYAHALTHPMEDLSNLVKLYAILSRMRLFAPNEILEHAQRVVDGLVNTYFAPNPTLPELYAMMKERRADLLEEFSTACRQSLSRAFIR